LRKHRDEKKSTPEKEKEKYHETKKKKIHLEKKEKKFNYLGSKKTKQEKTGTNV
jgi:hypothetical protein